MKSVRRQKSKWAAVRQCRWREDVKIVPLKMRCARRIYQWMCDPRLRSDIGLKSNPTMEKTRQWIQHAAKDHSMRPFAIMAGEAHVGNVVLDQIDQVLNTVRMSIYIGDRNSRGKGIGFTAAYLCLEHAFRCLHVYKVWLTVHEKNAVAISLYQRLGFVLEGVLRFEFLLADCRINVLRMGMLQTEFDFLASALGERSPTARL